ncbi:MAG: DUF4430 domain-containing protein [Lachnospiraceae bacterium]|nr:DUF4430 domain-containing protein [Lachnospiraceae bacterium]
MKNKLVKILISCMAMLSVLTNAGVALATGSSAGSNISIGVKVSDFEYVQKHIDGIIDYKLNETGTATVQEWIDTDLTQNAGISAEWYVIALRQSGTYDFSQYETVLLQYLAENEVRSASSRQKYALVLLACGSADEYINRTQDDSIGKQGVMSWIFGLHLLNNGCTRETYSTTTVQETLLSLQLADGGWAVMGANGDVDVTAMALQALAPQYETDAAVKEAVDKALTFLSARQQETGDYASYGVNNAESTAQVMIALSALGIDCASDARFIKDGNTLLDGLTKYRLADGSFCHEKGGAANEASTAQVFCAFVSYERMTNGEKNLYLFEDNDDKATVTDAETDNKGTGEQPTKSNYKLPVTAAILIACAIICLIMYLTKKRNKKDYMALLILAAIALALVWLTNFQTVDDYYNSDNGVKENAIGTVTLTIKCDTVAGESGAEHIPQGGIILDGVEFEIEDGDTVFDLLTEAVRKYEIHMESSGTGATVYVEGLNHLYEFDYGDRSGWLYYVNDTDPSVSCGEYVLKDGDDVAWYYSCDSGQDIKFEEASYFE